MDTGREEEARRPGLLREYWFFLGHHKVWWVTLIILALLALAALVLLTEAGPAMPFMYSVH